MKALLDTSMLVARFYGDHEHHAPSLELFLRLGKKDACRGAQSLAEVYAILTGMFGKGLVGADAALLFLGNIRDKLRLVSLDEQDYFQIVEEAATANLASGAIYDALLEHCALKARADTLYTWKTKDLLRLPSAIANRVSQPDQ